MTPAPPARRAGFTAVEAMVVVAIVAILTAVGMPSMSKWLMKRRAQSATGYYMDGFQMARNMAIEYNAASRLVLSENATNGQMQWQVDVCFPTVAAPCDAASDNWSSADTAVSDPYGRTVKSVGRDASGLPPDSVLDVALQDGATAAYFTPLGWLNTAVTSQLTKVTLSSTASPALFPSTAVAVTLAGIASRCSPSTRASAARACPP